MTFAPKIDLATIQAAEDACAAARKRFDGGDYTCSSDEMGAYQALLEGAKRAGIRGPFDTIVAASMVTNLPAWRATPGPLHARRLTPPTK